MRHTYNPPGHENDERCFWCQAHGHWSGFTKPQDWCDKMPDDYKARALAAPVPKMFCAEDDGAERDRRDEDFNEANDCQLIEADASRWERHYNY